MTVNLLRKYPLANLLHFVTTTTKIMKLSTPIRFCDKSPRYYSTRLFCTSQSLRKYLFEQSTMMR